MQILEQASYLAAEALTEEKSFERQPFKPPTGGQTPSEPAQETGRSSGGLDSDRVTASPPPLNNGRKRPIYNGKEVRYEVTPEFWENLAHALPPWIEEISAIVLLVFGVISLMAVLNVSSDATLAIAWSKALTKLFGYGSVIVSIGIFLLGVVILLPKAGIVVKFPVWRVLALEIAFLATLAILHLVEGDPQLRALAREGKGGGYLGWGLSMPLDFLLGRSLTLAVYFFALVASVALFLGTSRSHLSKWLKTGSDKLEGFGYRLIGQTQDTGTSRRPTREPPALPYLPSTLSLDETLLRRFSMMRIRPDLDSLPPSQRLENNSMLPPTIAEQIAAAPIPNEVSERLERALTRASEVVPEKKRKLDAEITIGTLLPPPQKKDAPQLVQRPDGRVKRYFTASGLQEEKKIGKRDKALPPLELLQDVEIVPPDDFEINHNVVLIENTLLEFDIHIDVVNVKVGPTVTQYAVQPFREVQRSDGAIIRERTRLNRIVALADDLALSLSAKRLRMETPVPGQNFLGVEVPNKNPGIVALRSVYESKALFQAAQKNKSPLLIPLGRDVAGAPVAVDIGLMPHLLIAGTTGSGKSVCIAAMATALVLNNLPDRVKLVMLDPKMVELSRFNGLPHLLGPVETDMDRIIGVLRWCTREMDRRYKVLEEHSARNIETHNDRLGQRRKSEWLPYIVIMVDEIGDMMMLRPEETEATITRLAQMARAVGIHLVVATQRPSVDVITGLIKANFPVRISFAVAAGVDSRVILDTVGAENLLGKGDLLYLAQDASGPKRLQGCFVSDNEVRAVVSHWKQWHEEQIRAGKARRVIFPPWEQSLTRREFLAETDPMLEDAIALVVEEQEASASQIQRKLGLGYPRAARIIDLLEELGVVGEQVAGGRTRRVLIGKGQDPYKVIWENRKRRQ